MDAASDRSPRAHGLVRRARRRKRWPILASIELIEVGLASLAEIFGLDPQQLIGSVWSRRGRSIGRMILSLRGAYSYATPGDARRAGGACKLRRRPVFFSGEALYRGRDMGTVEAALASGLKTARTLLG